MDDDRDDDRVSLPLDPRVALKALLAVEPESPPTPPRQDEQGSDERDDDQR